MTPKGSEKPDKAEAATPHDALFQYVFSMPEHVAGELRAALPPELVARIDWASLGRAAGRLVDAALAQRQTDVLLSARIDGRRAFVYVLFEHQSTSDRWIALRVLRYVLMVWEAWRREHPRSKTLPPVLPVVLYHGAKRWIAPRRLSGLFALAGEATEVLGPFVPDFELVVDDLSAASTRQLYARSMTALGRAALHVLKRARRNDDIVGELARYIGVWREVLEAPGGLEAMAAVMRYLLGASKTPPERLRAFAARLGSGGEEAYMTGAQILREEGRAQGLAEGRAEGEAKGRAEGRAEALLRLLELKFGPVPAAVADRIRSASIADLDHWLERILTAETRPAVFAG